MSDCRFKGRGEDNGVIAVLRVLAGGGWLNNCRFKGLEDGLVIADLRVGGGWWSDCRFKSVGGWGMVE